MGVGAGIFRITNELAKTVNSANLVMQEQSLAEVYCWSAVQDKQRAGDFGLELDDWWVDGCVFSKANN